MLPRKSSIDDRTEGIGSGIAYMAIISTAAGGCLTWDACSDAASPDGRTSRAGARLGTIGGSQQPRRRCGCQARKGGDREAIRFY
jgi:hypothetical protein